MDNTDKYIWNPEDIIVEIDEDEQQPESPESEPPKLDKTSQDEIHPATSL